MQRIIQCSGIGKVCLRRSEKAKRISIHINPLQGVNVTLPIHASFELAENFVLAKHNWIAKHLLKMEHLKSKQTIYDHSTQNVTREHHLQLHIHSEKTIKVKIRNGIIEVYYPFEMDVKDNEVQESIRKGIEYAFRIEAYRFIPKRLKELAALHGFQYRKVTIKNTKTRWGSCSASNNLNFSLHVMRLPSHLFDYILLHELTHTIHKNHGDTFWQHLNNLTGNAKALDKEINTYRLDIF